MRVYKKTIVRYKDAAGRQVPKGTPGATKTSEKSQKWYGRVPGGKKEIPLCANKGAAQILLAELVRQAVLAQSGLADPFAAQAQRPLAEHVADFEAALLAKNGTAKQARQVAARVGRLLRGCQFVFASDLSASRTMEWLAEQRRPGALPDFNQADYSKSELAALLGLRPHCLPMLLRRHRLAAVGHGRKRRYPRAAAEALAERLARGWSVQTSNFYLQAVKQFCRWMVKDRRMAENPLAYLEAASVRTDRRHDRRELTEDELSRLLQAARASGKTFRGLTGWDRYHLYAVACGTGFRASALASLTPESFDLGTDIPTVALAAARNKSRVGKVQPLPADVAHLLEEYVADKPAGEPLWGGTWARDHKGAEMLRIDLEAAGIPYVVEGPDGPLYLDFHALRHTYLTLGGRAGIDLRTLQELAGHSSPLLTARYSHRRLYDLAGAVEKLPRLLPDEDTERGRATGTD